MGFIKKYTKYLNISFTANHNNIIMEDSQRHNFSPIWNSMPASIRWQIYHKNKDKNIFDDFEKKILSIKEGISIGIILNIASMVEGFLEESARRLFFEVIKRCNIDEIDVIFAQHYVFTKEKLDFIINYDIKYRMRKDLDAYIDGALGKTQEKK